MNKSKKDMATIWKIIDGPCPTEDCSDCAAYIDGEGCAHNQIRKIFGRLTKRVCPKCGKHLDEESE